MEVFEKYLSEMSIDQSRVNSNIQSNDVKIILGLTVPKFIIDWLFGTELKEKIDNLNDIDNSIRNDYDDSEETLSQYASDKKLLLENIFQEINKNIYFNKLVEKHFFNEENYNKIKRDYYKVFIIKNVVSDCDLTSCEDMLDFILENIVESNKDLVENPNLFKQFCQIVLYSQAYSNALKHYCLIFQKFKEFIPNLLQEMKKFIQTDRIKEEISARNPEHKMLLNKPFLIVFESMLHASYNNRRLSKKETK
jgi:hypothetical protein